MRNFCNLIEITYNNFEISLVVFKISLQIMLLPIQILLLLLLLLLFIIVIESLLFPVLIICVLFDWSVSLSKRKVGTVGCTLWLALSKQIKILFFFL